MHKKNRLLFIIISLIILGLCISSISAADNSSVLSNVSSTNDSTVISNTSNNYSVINNSTNNNKIIKSNNVGVYGANVNSSNSGSFTDLNNKIYNGGNYIVLNQNYTYNPNKDSSFKNGITISKPITINGNGYTINGLNMAEAFNIKSKNVIIANCTFINTNSTTYGGAIYWNNGNNGSIYNCTFINSTGRNGGAIFLFKGNNCSIDYCRFISTKSDSGGVVYWYGASGILSNCKFINTTSNDGGAVFWNDGKNTKIINCTFNNTHSDKFGGAILLFGVPSLSKCNIANCNFINTSSDNQGGAIYWYGPNGTIENCNFINDTSLDNGGAISCIICNNGIINNCSFINCSAYEGSALYQENNYLIISNSIILNNRANSTALTINKSGSNVIIRFNGLNNLFNGISTNGTVNATNLTYWGVNGVTNTGSLSKIFKPNNFTPEGIGLKITVLNNEDEVLLSKVYYTDDNGRVLIDLSNLPTKYYKIIAVLNNETYYTAISNNKTFDLRNNVEKTIIKNITYGNQVITVIFDDNVTGNVSVYINNTKYTGIISNGVSNINIGIKDAGDYVTNVSYSGDDNYLNFTNKEVNFTINKTSPILIINASNITYGNNVTININLTGVNGVGLNDTVNLTINGTKYIVNVVDGVGSQLISMPNVGVYNVTASYDSTNNYFAVVNATEFSVVKAGPGLVVNVDNVTYGNDVIVRVRLVGVNGAGLNGTVDVVIDGTKYIVNVVDGVGSFVVAKPGAAVYDVSASYAGNENYTSVSNKTSFKVSKADLTVFNVTVNNSTYGENNIVNITAIGVNGELINGTVAVTIDGRVYSVILSDGVGSLVVSGFVPGTYGVVLSFPGNENYTGVSNGTEFSVVKAGPGLVVNVDNVTYGNDVIVRVRLVGVNGAGLNGTVSINLDNFEILKSRSLLGSNIIKIEVINGEGVYIFTHPNAGIYNISANYPGNENYTSVSNKTSFKVSKADLTVFNVTVNNSTYGENNTVNITAIGVNGELINGTVNVNINGKDYDVTLKDGKATLNINNLSADNYNVKISFGDNNYNNITNETSFIVNKANTNLNVSLIDTKFNGKNYTARFNISLVGSNGALLNNTVNVTIDNKHYAVNIINGTGILEVNDLYAGNYTVESEFIGDNNYNPSNNTMNFTIDNLKPDLTIKVVTNKNNATIYVTLSYNGTGLNGTVIVTVNNKHYTVNVINGKGNLTITNLKNGKYPVNAVFNGDNIYSSAYANTTFTINVPDDGNKSDNNKSNIVPFNNNSNIDNNSIIMNDNMPKTGNPITLLFAVLCILGLICKRKH